MFIELAVGLLCLTCVTGKLPCVKKRSQMLRDLESILNNEQQNSQRMLSMEERKLGQQMVEVFKQKWFDVLHQGEKQFHFNLRTFSVTWNSSSLNTFCKRTRSGVELKQKLQNYLTARWKCLHWLHIHVDGLLCGLDSRFSYVLVPHWCCQVGPLTTMLL